MMAADPVAAGALAVAMAELLAAAGGGIDGVSCGGEPAQADDVITATRRGEPHATCYVAVCDVSTRRARLMVSSIPDGL